jgi:hypothetical protein
MTRPLKFNVLDSIRIRLIRAFRYSAQVRNWIAIKASGTTILTSLTSTKPRRPPPSIPAVSRRKGEKCGAWRYNGGISYLGSVLTWIRYRSFPGKNIILSVYHCSFTEYVYCPDSVKSVPVRIYTYMVSIAARAREVNYPSKNSYTYPGGVR